MAYRNSKEDLDNKLTKKFLIEEYIKNKKSANLISLECNCCDDTINKYLKKFNILKRSRSESCKLEYWLFGVKCKNLNKELLYTEYIINKFTIKELSEKYNISEASIFRRLNYFEIKTRGYCHKLDLNPNWIDGRSFEPYSSEFNEQFKEQIRKRDNYQCQCCGFTNEEHLITWDESLPIHHIDYDKKNNKENNLIATCKQCNVRANYNRPYWIIYYQKIMEKKNGNLSVIS